MNDEHEGSHTGTLFPHILILLGIFVFTTITDIFMTLWGIRNGYIEVNPLTAALIYNNHAWIWVLIRLTGAGIICAVLIRMSKYDPVLTFGSLTGSFIVALIGIIQVAGNLQAMGI